MTIFESGSSGVEFNYSTELSGYTKQGVGIGDDLKIKIKKGIFGRWFPLITKGWYYKGTSERYLFAEKAGIQVDYGTHSTIESYALTGTSSVPTSAVLDYGPIFLNDNNSTDTFIQVCGPLRTYRPATWTSVTDTNLWTAPVSGLLINVTSTKYGDLWNVPASGYISSDEYYYYNELLSLAFVASDGNPSGTVFLTYTTSASGQELLLQEEIHIVDAYRKIRTAYAHIAIEDTTRLPQVTSIVSTGILTTEVASTQVGTGSLNNQITLASPITSGNQVAISYYVNQSFVVDNGEIAVYATSAMTGTCNYEASIAEHQDLSSLASSDLSYVQLNPIYSGVGPGFLFLAEAQATSAQADKLYITHSPTRAQVLSGTGPPVRIAAYVVDKDNNPLPGVSLSSSAIGDGRMATSAIIPTTQITDWNGAVTYSWTPTGAGTTTFTIEVSTTTSSSLSGQAAFVQVVSPIIGYSGTQVPRKIFLYADTDNVIENKAKVHVMLTAADGTPYIGGSTLAYLVSKNSKFEDQTTASSYYETTVGNTGIVTLQYYLIGRDIIYAYFYDSTISSYVYSDKVIIGV